MHRHGTGRRVERDARWEELSPAEQARLERWEDMGHPSNKPANLKTTTWRVCAECGYVTGWLMGFVTFGKTIGWRNA